MGENDRFAIESGELALRDTSGSVSCGRVQFQVPFEFFQTLNAAIVFCSMGPREYRKGSAAMGSTDHRRRLSINKFSKLKQKVYDRRKVAEKERLKKIQKVRPVVLLRLSCYERCWLLGIRGALRRLTNFKHERKLF